MKLFECLEKHMIEITEISKKQGFNKTFNHLIIKLVTWEIRNSSFPNFDNFTLRSKERPLLTK